MPGDLMPPLAWKKQNSLWPRVRLLFIWISVAGLLAVGMRFFTNMPYTSYSGPFVPLSSQEKVSSNFLEKHVVRLASDIGERNIWHGESLAAAANYIEKGFADQGLASHRQKFQVEGVDVANIEAEFHGEKRPEEIVVIGAHYDSVLGSPGANDNATGVAALLELARLLRERSLNRTVRLIAFVNEEPPFFMTPKMGSSVSAARSYESGENIVAMLSLETMGYYSDKVGSQRYPFLFRFFYPDTANFIGFVGNLASRKLVGQSLTAFRENTLFPSEGLAAPGWVTGVGWSDHWSYWKNGYPAIMVTDTALFRYDFYHTAADTPEKIDYDRLARVVKGVVRVVLALSGSSR